MKCQIISLLLCAIVVSGISGCTQRNNYNSPFQSQYVVGLTQPEVIIQNKSDSTIQVSLFRETHNNNLQEADKIWTISPSQIINAAMDPGEYRYHATCPGVIPASGTTHFEKNYRYSWVFYIKTRTY